MTRTRVFTKMLPGDSPKMPAIRIEFRGKYQVDYFSVNKIAKEDFENSTGTSLARLILHEWLMDYQRRKREGRGLAGNQQMVMILSGERESASKKKSKKERKDGA